MGSAMAMVAVMVMLAVAMLATCHAAEETLLRMPVEADLSDHALLAGQFAAWAEKHGKVYSAVEERAHRFLVWKENLAYIQRHSEKNLSYWLGLTKFADLTNEEFRRQYTGTRIDRSRRARRKTGFRYADSEAPDAVDWREKGAVTTVKDQGSCGMCADRLETLELGRGVCCCCQLGSFRKVLWSFEVFVCECCLSDMP